MRKILKSGKLFIVGILLCHFNLSRAQVDGEDPYTTLTLQKKAVIGTWMNTGYNTDEVGDHNWTMKFTREGKCYWYYPGDEVEIYTYTINPYNDQGYDAYALKIKNIEDPDDHYGYVMYIGRDESNNFDEMSLSSGLNRPWMNPGNFVFKKISEPPSSKISVKEEELTPKPKPSAELEEESEPLLHWGFKLSDRDRGYFDGGLAYQQCKEEQDKEDRDIFDRHRLMPIEGMEWESKAPKLGLGDCREEAFERIKMSTKEYQEGFKKGWRDASMPLNKEKETTKKK